MKHKQIVFTEANKAELRTMDTPDRLEEGQIRVETLYTLVSPGTEISWYSGIQKDVAGDEFTYPVYSGYCHAGRISEMAAGISEYQVGDLVTSGAAHASRVIIDVKPKHDVSFSDPTQPIRKVPTGLPVKLAPFSRIGEIAMTAIRIAEFSLDDKVLVIGLGMVGNFASQLFQLAGADVLAVDLSGFRQERARTCGIRNVLNSSEHELELSVQEWSEGRGADVVVESVGNSSLILESIRMTRRLGEVILLGTPRRRMELNPSPYLWQSHMKGVRLKGARRSLFYPIHPSSYSRYSVSEDLKTVLKLMESSALKVEPLHTDTFQPAECQEAFQHIKTANDRSIGVLFDWTETESAG
jgi:2-desacetyl-2-hydroxyethyl bacteriochlorophyllide A dehydrogenase